MDNIFILMIEQWQIYLKYHQRMGTLLLKKHINRDKCNIVTKSRMFGFGTFAIDERQTRNRALLATLYCSPKP